MKHILSLLITLMLMIACGRPSGNTPLSAELQRVEDLLCTDFSTKEIAVITRQASSTVYFRKTSARQKTSAPDFAFISLMYYFCAYYKEKEF